MGDGDFVWSGDDEDASDDGATDPDDAPDSEDATDDGTSSGAGDSADARTSSGEGEPREESGPAGDPDATPTSTSTFEDLLEGIEPPFGDAGDLDRLADALPADVTFEEPEGIERLLERAGSRGAGAGQRTPPADATGEPGGGDRHVDDSASDELTELFEGESDPGGSHTARADTDAAEPAPSPEGAPESRPHGTDEGSSTVGEGDESRSAAPGGSNPFEDLVSRVDVDAAGRTSRGRPGTSRSGERAASVDPGAIPADASGVLLLDSPEDVDDFETCLSHIQQSRPERTNLLLVWLSRDVTDRLERLYETYAERSTNVTVVCRSKVGRSFYANPQIPTDAPGGNLSIQRISDPRDLPKLGIAISQVIADWQGRSKHTVMCFHSITDLLQFADHERVFRFLHVLQGRVDSIDATAHYHLDRDAHDERTVAMFWNLFDATVDVTAGTNERER